MSDSIEAQYEPGSPQYKPEWIGIMSRWNDYLRKLLRIRFRLCRSRMKMTATDVGDLLADGFHTGASFDCSGTGDAGNE